MDIKKSSTKHPNNKKRRRILIILSTLFLLVGFLWLIYWLIWGRFEEYTDDAYVNGNIVQLMPQVAGTVIAINTDDTQLVEEGQVIVKLDPNDTQIALQLAKANLADTVRQVRRYFENVYEAQATLILRKADLIKAQLDLKRRVNLAGKRAVSREELQHYTTNVDTAQAQYHYALHNLQATLALVQNTHLYTHPLVERAKENLKMAFLNLKRTTILAPTSGIIAKRSVQVGQQVNLSTPLLAIIPLNEIWVDANYKESQLDRLRLGQPVTLFADAYSGVTYHGKLLGINAGTGSAFSLLPPQNATGNWIKIVQRLPVRIGLDTDEIKKHPLQIGLSMRVTTNTHNQTNPRLPGKPILKTVYATDVYTNQLADVNHLIDDILHTNAPDMTLPNMTLQTELS